MHRLKKGLVQVYTGNGKGKTTAAIGQAIRAAGHSLRVYMIQFMKDQPNSGELKIIQKLKPNFIIKQYGQPSFFNEKNPKKADFEIVQKAWNATERIVRSGKWDIVILDEINVVLNYKLISLEKVVELIKSKPSHVELIFTGRNAHPEILKLADLVSEILEIKHPYEKNMMPRVGIEV